MSEKRRIILLTGMAGAGLTTARSTLQDQGFTVVDNLPLDMVSELLSRNQRPLALGLDVRTEGFSPAAILELLGKLNAQPDISPSLLYLDCDDSVLIKRFSETRRAHPLATDRPFADSLKIERELLAPLKARADLSLDTTDLSTTALRQVLSGHFPADASRGLMVHVMSFSYRQGLPSHADDVEDARFLQNPHYVEALRAHTGQDEDVGAYVSADPDFPAYLEALKAKLTLKLRRLSATERNYFTLAFGCTGGKHRSVYLAETISRWLSENGQKVTLSHRELARNGLLRK